MSELLASINNKQFLGRSSSGKNDLGLTDPVLDLTSLLNFSFSKSIFGGVNLSESITVDDNSFASIHGLFLGVARTIGFGGNISEVSEFKLGISDDVDLGSNSSSCRRLITSNHDNLDTGILALFYGDIDLRSRRIIERNNTNKSKTPHWVPSLNTFREFFNLLPLFPVLGVERIRSLSVSLGFEFVSSESQNTLTHASELIVSSVNISAHVISEIDLFTLVKNLSASRKNSLRSSLEEDSHVIFGS
mmetsp:Transcript_30208/g.21953  ORF Transcript_30208/g.21953 Transcript_30208/m.21953 type:complete len:247 (+) Transcript_30208:1224-1964(+)